MSMAELLAAEGIYVRGYQPQQQQHLERLPVETLPPPEEEEDIAIDLPPPSHERAEANTATEEEVPCEEIIEQCHEDVPFPPNADSVQGHHVDVSSIGESDKLIEQIIHEIELLCGVRKTHAYAPRIEGVSSGRCVPKMAYLKYIGRKDQFPPPFIP
jgi:hypothetical protein